MTERRRRERQEEFVGGGGIQPASRLFVDVLLLVTWFRSSCTWNCKKICIAEGIAVSAFSFMRGRWEVRMQRTLLRVPLGPISIAAAADGQRDRQLGLLPPSVFAPLLLPQGHLDWKGCRAGSSPPATTTALLGDRSCTVPSVRRRTPP